MPTLSLGGAVSAAVSDMGTPYEPGTNLPELGSSVRLSFTKSFDPQKRMDQWVCKTTSMEGITVYLCDYKHENFSKIEESVTWECRLSRIVSDQPSRDDESVYHRVIIVQPICKYMSKKAQKRLERERQKNPVPTTQVVENKVESKPNRRLSGICFQLTGVNWTFSFTTADDSTELYILTTPPKELLPQRYKHLGPANYTVPLNVEVVRLVSEEPKFKRFEVKVIRTVVTNQ